MNKIRQPQPGCARSPYELLRPLLFSLDPERAHDLSINILQRAGFWFPRCTVPAAPVTVMGLTFPHRVGLAAGFDKNGVAVEALSRLGFAFVEVGTVTPQPQPGNARPRLFRLPRQQGIINRLGFNNHGVEALAAQLERLRRRRFTGIVGVNIGKNKNTATEDAVGDYLRCLRRVHALADYITLNVSSPNTPQLRDLQSPEALRALLDTVLGEREKLQTLQRRRVPIVVKIAPDIGADQLQAMARVFLESGVDGVIATNTTVARPGLADEPQAAEGGGLSGAPLEPQATDTLRQLAALLHGRLPLIGVGGILTGADAQRKADAGAQLVQIYSGFIFRGPALIGECAAALQQKS